MKKVIVALCLLTCAMCKPAPTLSVDEFEMQVQPANAVQLVDVRTPQEFEKYHLKNAVNIDFRGANFRRAIESLDKTKPVYVYCLLGGRSRASLDVFREAGFAAAYDLEGGMIAWLKAGKPIDQDLSGKGELSVADYDAAVSAEGYVLVDFYGPWCTPCRKMLPMVRELSQTYAGKFKLLTVDFDQNRLLVNEKNVVAVPHLMIFKDGKKVWEKEGEATRVEIMKWLELK